MKRLTFAPELPFPTQPVFTWQLRSFEQVVDGYMCSCEMLTRYVNLGHIRRVLRGPGPMSQVGSSLTTCTRPNSGVLRRASFTKGFASNFEQTINFISVK